MNEKEASQYQHLFVVIQDPNLPATLPELTCRAFGYLEALEKAKAIEEALKKQIESCSYPNKVCSVCNSSANALTEWEKLK